MPDRLNSPKEVLRFMGMINFNRRFIFMLSDLAAPLYALLKPDDTRTWDERWTEASAQVRGGYSPSSRKSLRVVKVERVSMDRSR